MIIGISGKIGSGKDTIATIIQALSAGIKVENIANVVKWYSKHNYNQLFLEKTSWEVHKFADSLKDIVCILIGCTREDLEDQDFKNKELGEEWSKWEVRDWNKFKWEFSTKEEAFRFVDKSNSQHSYSIIEIKTTPRKLLQLVGTECGRNILHENVWINATFSNYVEDRGYSYDVKIREKREDSATLEVLNDPKTYNNGYPNWVITDVRFPNEAQAIKDKGGLLFRTERNISLLGEDGKVIGIVTDYDDKTMRKNLPQFNHPSETALDNYQGFDHIFNNNGTIEQLIEQIKQVLLNFKIIN